MLQTESLSIHFGGLAAVDNVTVNIDSKELVGVIGPNGAGKTTLFNIITGFLKPTAGKVIFDGENITGNKPHTIAHKGLCRTFQVTKPFEHLKIIDNVLISCLWYESNMNAARDIAMEKLKLVGLGHLAQQLATGLPVGQRKRLEVARVLAAKPKMVLLDEIMGGLTPPEVRELSEVVANIHAQGTGVVMIEHVMSAVMKLSHRILVLNQGKLIASGTPEEIRNNNHVIEAYLGKRFSRQHK